MLDSGAHFYEVYETKDGGHVSMYGSPLQQTAHEELGSHPMRILQQRRHRATVLRRAAAGHGPSGR